MTAARPRALLAAALAVLAVLLLLAACGSSGSGDESGTAAAGEDRFAAADPLPEGLAGRAAATMRLTDARGGRAFDSASLRGKPYLVTFLFANCPDVCPLIGQQLRQSLEELGPEAERVAVVAVSVDPRGDTPAAVREWLERQRQPEQFHYLIGSEAELAPVWRAWYAAPQIAGDPDSAHTAVVWLVDGEGRLAGKIAASAPFEPADLAADLRTLLADAPAAGTSGS